MIESIAHKGLRLLWEKDDPSKLPPEQIEKIRCILSALKYGQNFRAIADDTGIQASTA